MTTRTFTRTAAALAAYDAAGDAVDQVDLTNHEACAVGLTAWDAALRAVGEAFADDTADINDRALVLEGFRFHHFDADLRHARRIAGLL